MSTNTDYTDSKHQWTYSDDESNTININMSRNHTDIDEIEEDSSLRKVIACVPVIGLLSTVFNEYSLRDKIQSSRDDTTSVKLIEVKNDYKKAAIVRELLLAAVFATLLIIGIIRGHTVSQHITRGVAMGVLTGVAIFHGYGISHNNKMIDAIEDGRAQGRLFKVY